MPNFGVDIDAAIYAAQVTPSPVEQRRKDESKD